MQIAFLGTGDFAVRSLETLARAGFEVVRVISQPDRPAGRGRKVVPTPVRSAAERLGLPHIQTDDINALDFAATFGGAEIGVVAAFGQRIGPAILAGLPRGCINLHGSILPKYRGAAPYQWAIINGEQTTGVTVFQLDQKWDHGPIWGCRETPIGDTETADELHDRLATLAAELIVDTLPAIVAGTLEPRTQDAQIATRAPKLSKADCEIDWAQPARQVVRRINGLWSWPTATCVFASRTGKRERLQLARAALGEQDSQPISDTPSGGVRSDGAIQTGAGSVRLLEVKPAGGKLMDFAAFSNGRDVQHGDLMVPLGTA
ncbi:MAG: methionyl-tRNA formyltransferase [Phycisphaerae bacterium]|nr:methionyl-tRNA formyltransferase [Phycisphaerae bacterium]